MLAMVSLVLFVVSESGKINCSIYINDVNTGTSDSE
jgi:hypothetical protein